MPNEISETVVLLPATSKINTVTLLDQLIQLSESNMKGDGKFTDQQINNQVRVTSVIINLAKLEIQKYKLTNKN